MSGSHASCSTPRTAATAVLLIAALTVLPQAHAATNLFNVYVGAAYAHSNLRARDTAFNPSNIASQFNSFDRSGSGYQFSLGVRALEMLGAEVDYFDLGRGSVSNLDSLGGTGVSASSASIGQKGEAAFAMLYLPIPIVDFYVKAGIDRIGSNLNARYLPHGIYCGILGCQSQYQSLAVSKTTTGLALGAGAQWQVGNWGVRAEYERFTAYGGHPDLVSLGVVWTIL